MGLDEMESYRELILENIDYDILLERNPWDKDLLDGYVELMLEICCSTRESAAPHGNLSVSAGRKYPPRLSKAGS